MTVAPDNTVDWAIGLLREARTVAEVHRVLKGSVRAAVGAQGATVVELHRDQCHYADEDAMSPLWKGQRFPVQACISGWSMIHGETVVIPDIRADRRIPQEAYRPTFVRSLVMVPIMVGSAIGAIGAYWGRLHRAIEAEVAALERLAAEAGRALARVTAADGRDARSPGVVAGRAVTGPLG